jgi:16S rRNA (guanine966-N2)-methyltransferase
MTRVIAGEFGGRALAVPKSGTRPTTDRVREALFSRLDHADDVRGVSVVDLFAGSGALGFEALSRGASHVTFVESALPAARVIEENIRTLGVGTRAELVRERASAFLRRSTAEYGLALIDPPYDIASGDVGEVLESLVPRLAPGATVVLEFSRRNRTPEWPRGLELVQSKNYGETMLYFVDRVGAERVR